MARSSIILLLVVLLGLVPGCAAGVVAAGAAGGYGAFRHFENWTTRDYRASLRATYEATSSVLPTLGYQPVKTSVLGPTEGQIEAGGATVRFASYPGSTTRVSVSVGTFNNEDNRRRAALVHEALAKQLGLSFR